MAKSPMKPMKQPGTAGRKEMGDMPIAKMPMPKTKLDKKMMKGIQPKGKGCK